MPPEVTPTTTDRVGDASHSIGPPESALQVFESTPGALDNAAYFQQSRSVTLLILLSSGAVHELSRTLPVRLMP